MPCRLETSTPPGGIDLLPGELDIAPVPRENMWKVLYPGRAQNELNFFSPRKRSSSQRFLENDPTNPNFEAGYQVAEKLFLMTSEEAAT